MSAAWTDLENFAEATEVDVRALPRRVKGRLVSAAPLESPVDAPEENPSSRDHDLESAASGPPGPGRLSELHLRSVKARRAAAPNRSSSMLEAGRPRLVFARVDDPALRLRRTPHGFELSGQPSPQTGRHERRLAVAFDQQLFAVVIQPSDTTREILTRLAERVRGDYEARISQNADGSWSMGFFDSLRASA